jgi:hypothetical protein
MNWRWLSAAILTIGFFGCAAVLAEDPAPPAAQQQDKTAQSDAGGKIPIAQLPEAVRRTVERELAGAELEDIEKKQLDGKTVYETDIIRNGQKWEVIVAEDGSIVSKAAEGSAEEQALDKKDEAQQAAWKETFDVKKADLMPTGSNPFITIQPGRVLKMKNGIDMLTITILPDTKEVDGVKCGVLEERETKDGKLIEVSRNYFATDKNTGDVYYFGEDVDNYKDGKIINHESAWLAGEKGAKFGLMIPAKPRVGDKYYQEIAPKVAMDRVEVVSTDETITTPAGKFDHVVHLKETTPIEPDVSHKYYAPGIGLIKDDDFELAEKP